MTFSVFCDIYDLAAHLDEFDGTLVRRGTPVEKHCSTPLRSFMDDPSKESEVRNIVFFFSFSPDNLVYF